MVEYNESDRLIIESTDCDYDIIEYKDKQYHYDGLIALPEIDPNYSYIDRSQIQAFMIDSHPNGAEASDIDRHVAYQYSKHNYVYFAIYDSKKHILRSYQPFNDYEESIWKQNH